ncbi:LAME_0H04896g1_1 [Lachancea meyersii CBS 8951]|uniref:LAME_0H04896g1_1 n=1 Tax=Lachancea meyersii CBS 8951 TaxID=1266667 RepID=A0A1G4KE19_9SACH|nr:LAME_0H04896g1_1 [Lachancea meyersii CBS 8951]
MQYTRESAFGKAPQAPYSRIFKTQNGKKRSFLSKVKSLFANNKSDAASSFNLVRAPEFLGARTPGGFYDQPSESLVAAKHRQVEKRQKEQEDVSRAESLDEANVSNSALASFFRQKGDEALSEVEYEGVLSLMKKSRNVSTELFPRSEFVSESSILQADASPVLKSDANPGETSLKTPQYYPKYDNSFTTANTSMKSTSSTNSRKSRVFDYSSLPSPYRSRSYRHGVVDFLVSNKKAKTNEDSVTVSENPAQEKLSNTASALLSLLDSGETKQQPSGLANPYSSRVSELKKFKKSVEPQLSAPDTPSKGVINPAQSIALSEIQNSEEKEGSKNEKVSVTQQFTKYKPEKASSLRTTVSAPKSSQDDLSRGHDAESSSSAVPKSMAFNFSYPQSSRTDSTSVEGPAPGAGPSLTSEREPRSGEEFKGAEKSDSRPAMSFSLASQPQPQHRAELQSSKKEFEPGSGKSSFTIQINRKANTLEKPEVCPPNTESRKPHKIPSEITFDFTPPPKSGFEQEFLNVELVNSLKSTFAF